jgi:hypothetical protein
MRNEKCTGSRSASSILFIFHFSFFIAAEAPVSDRAPLIVAAVLALG